MNTTFAVLRATEAPAVFREFLIDRYIEKFVWDWGCKIDHEDGSTAPFSSLAMEEVSGYEETT